MVEEIYGSMGLKPPTKQKAANDGIDEDIREEI
jgi:hypothetical protein